MISLSDNVYMKPLLVEDIPYLFQLIDDERSYLRQWLPFVDFTIEQQDTQNYVEYALGMCDTPQFTIYQYEQCVGLIGFKNYEPENMRIEMGYWLSQKAQGQGIMTCAVQSLLSFAFYTMKLNRVSIRAAVGNSKSRRIPEKLGFTLEGIERDGELLVDHVFTDLAVYSLLQSEFRAEMNE